MVLEMIREASSKEMNKSGFYLLGLIAPQSAFIDRALVFLKKGNQLVGPCRKGLSTKVHLALSTGGIQSSSLSEGQRVDMKAFAKLWESGEWSGIQYMQIKGTIILLYVHPSKRLKKPVSKNHTAFSRITAVQSLYKSYLQLIVAIFLGTR